VAAPGLKTVWAWALVNLWAMFRSDGPVITIVQEISIGSGRRYSRAYDVSALIWGFPICRYSYGIGAGSVTVYVIPDDSVSI